MNKLSLIFTALRVYRQARGNEASTLRGVITGTLAAGVVVGLGFMGADLSAEQIGLILAAITGIDAVLKIVLPDQLGGRNNGKTNAAQNLGNADSVRVDPDPAHVDNRLPILPAHGESREASRPGPAPQRERDELGRDGSA